MRDWLSRFLVVVVIVALAAARAAVQARPTTDQLLTAVEKSEAAAVAALLDGGADVNGANSYGLTALFMAADRANTELVKLLLARGADPNRTQELMWGRTALSV